MKILNQTKHLVALLAVATALNALAADKTSSSPFLGALSGVASAELPAKAAALVSQTEAKAQPQATVDVVKAAVGLNPAAAAAVVGSIAQKTPDMAAIAAATAVVLVPDQAIEIARVAAAAAPSQAGKIVESICRLMPKQYKEVAKAVAEVAPGQDKEILTGIASAMPELQKLINKSLLGYASGTPSVDSVLTQVSKSQSLTDPSTVASDSTPTATSPARGPSAGAPFVPVSGTPVVSTPGSGGVTPDPVNYSAP